MQFFIQLTQLCQLKEEPEVVYFIIGKSKLFSDFFLLKEEELSETTQQNQEPEEVLYISKIEYQGSNAYQGYDWPKWILSMERWQLILW